MTYTYHNLGEKRVELLRDFFSEMFKYHLPLDIRVLETAEYDKVHGKRSDALIERYVVKGNPEAKNLLLTLDRVETTIFVRQHLSEKGGTWISPNSVVHEILHFYFPQLGEKPVETASSVFEKAFRCYETLHNNKPPEAMDEQTPFFLYLCKENDRLRKMAGLPEFSASTINKYEERMIEENREKKD